MHKKKSYQKALTALLQAIETNDLNKIKEAKVEFDRVTNPSKVTINEKERLYVIPCERGYSCLGFDVLERRYAPLATELERKGHPLFTPEPIGTLERYAQYKTLLGIVEREYHRTGWRSSSELTPALIGLEGKTVEIEYTWGEKIIGKVGKSTGFIPCHLLLEFGKNYGDAISPDSVKSVRLIK